MNAMLRPGQRAEDHQLERRSAGAVDQALAKPRLGID